MAQAANEQELSAALENGASRIEITANFTITSEKQILATTTITSAGNTTYTLTRDANYDGLLFHTASNTTTTFTNIILDGAKQLHSSTGTDSLISLSYGSLIIDRGTVLQNNRSTEGAAIISNPQEENTSLIIKGDALFKDNDAMLSGGALYLSTSSSSFLQISEQVHFEDNTANQGGALYIDRADTQDFLLQDDVVFNGNSAVSGGAIFLYQGGCTISGRVEFVNNQATNGGGIYASGYQIQIANTINIHNNSATSMGGAVYLQPIISGDFALHAQFSNNTAGAGGAICVNMAGFIHFLDVSEAHFNGNIARLSNGGAILIDGISTATEPFTLAMNNALFDDNTAQLQGGILYAGYTGDTPFSLFVNSSEFLHNTSTDRYGNFYIYRTAQVTLQVQNCTFEDNLAFGASVFLLAQRFEGRMDVQISDSTFINNHSTAAEGALTLQQGTINLQMERVAMRNNVATGNGGALSIYTDESAIDIQDCEFTGNQAENGGAIYHSSVSTLTIHDSTLSDNTALQNGPDIYANGAIQLGGRILLSSGIYLTLYASALHLSEQLSEDSVLQLVESPYIKINPEGTPIIAATATIPLNTNDANAFLVPSSGFAGWGPVLSADKRQILLSILTYRLQYENTKGEDNPNPLHYTVTTPTITLLPLSSSTLPFLGWYDAWEGGNEVTEITQGSYGDKVLYAHWSQPPYVMYQLVFDPNTTQDAPAQYVPENLDVRENDNVVLSGLVPIRMQALFLHWNTIQDGSGNSYQPSDILGPVLSSITLYAIWEI